MPSAMVVPASVQAQSFGEIRASLLFSDACTRIPFVPCGRPSVVTVMRVSTWAATSVGGAATKS
jgi:hypothetical protein